MQKSLGISSLEYMEAQKQVIFNQAKLDVEENFHSGTSTIMDLDET